jgi:hypothetical protein
MNADLKRVREGGIEDGNQSPTKRRAMSLSTAGEEDDDKLEDWMKVVEVRFKSSYLEFCLLSSLRLERNVLVV